MSISKTTGVSLVVAEVVVSATLSATAFAGNVLVDGPFEVDPPDSGWYGSGCRQADWPEELLAVASHYDRTSSVEVTSEFIAGSCPIGEIEWMGWQFEWPGTVIWEWTVRLFEDDEGRPGGEFRYWTFEDGVSYGHGGCMGVYIHEPPTLVAGERYWVSVSARVDHFQWGLGVLPDSPRRAMFRGASFGYPTWTPLSDIMDCDACGAVVTVRADPGCPDDTPVNDASWSRLRAVYR